MSLFYCPKLSLAIDLFFCHNLFIMNLLTTSEAAKILRVTPIRIRQMIREGKIEARQIGRDYVIEESSLESVKTYGKAGRPKRAENGDGGTTANEKPFKTIFDIEGGLAESLAGSLDSGLGDLSTNKKYMEGFGTKEAENKNGNEKTLKTAFDIAPNLMRRLLDKRRDLPADLSTNKEYLKDLGKKSAEKESVAEKKH